MALRKVVVISTTKSQPKEFYSEATNFGQLKDSLSEFGDISKMRAVVKESKATLELDEAVLPEGDFTVFLTPKQIKAGAIDIAAALTALRDKIYESYTEVIDSIEDGDFGEEDEVQEVAPKTATNRISAEDQAMLNQLANLR